MSMRPMLAAKLKKGETYDDWVHRWEWPMIGTPKLDGIRTFVHPDSRYGALTRTAKQVPNRALRALFWELRHYIPGFDGEMVWGDHESPDYSFQRTVSEFMSQTGQLQDFKYYVFDQIVSGERYEDRIEKLQTKIETLKGAMSDFKDFLVFVPYRILHSYKDMCEYEAEMLELGYEGIMLRDPNGMYKHGRSTMLQQGLIAVKRFRDTEAEIIGMEALMRNQNEAIIDAQGLTQRSSSKEFKVADNLMGKLVLRGTKNSDFPDVTFKLGTGFTEAQRHDFWENFDDYKGQIVTFKYLPHGVKDKPRNLSFKGIRPVADFDNS